jgi:hypothetical protein
LVTHGSICIVHVICHPERSEDLLLWSRIHAATPRSARDDIDATLIVVPVPSAAVVVLVLAVAFPAVVTTIVVIIIIVTIVVTAPAATTTVILRRTLATPASASAPVSIVTIVRRRIVVISPIPSAPTIPDRRELEPNAQVAVGIVQLRIHRLGPGCRAEGDFDGRETLGIRLRHRRGDRRAVRRVRELEHNDRALDGAIGPVQGLDDELVGHRGAGQGALAVARGRAEQYGRAIVGDVGEQEVAGAAGGRDQQKAAGGEAPGHDSNRA